MRAFLICYFAALALPVAAAEPIRYIQPDNRSGNSRAVIVDDLPLVHTAQLLPETRGRIVSTNIEQQLAILLDTNLPAVLRRANSGISKVVKLNFYIADTEVLGPLQHALASRFSGSKKPAVSFVSSALPLANARVAVDAVAIGASVDGASVRWFSPTIAGSPSIFSDAAVLPPGPKIFLSGMADTNALNEATLKTLQKMMAAIGNLGLGKSNVVQLKAFMEPISKVEAVKRQISLFFGGATPPLVFVGWSSPPPNPPIEIELIASANAESSKDAETVTFLTPPGTASTKVFSRVARVNHGRLIYFSSFYGPTGSTADAQANSIFQQLGTLAQDTGTDFQHLLKATYYVSDEAASRQLNEIRPRFFDPQRPPAASKAKVAGVGLPGRTMMVDMIAVKN